MFILKLTHQTQLIQGNCLAGMSQSGTRRFHSLSDRVAPRNLPPNFESLPAPVIFNLMFFVKAVKYKVILRSIVYLSVIFCQIKNILNRFAFFLPSSRNFFLQRWQPYSQSWLASLNVFRLFCLCLEKS